MRRGAALGAAGGLRAAGRFPALTQLPELPTGNPAFDLRYAVAVLPGADQQPLTWDVQQRIMAREDWVFRAERYVLACVSAGAFAAVEEVSQRIGEVLAIAEGIGAAVTPVTVDDSDDELLARAGRPAWRTPSRSWPR